MKNNIEKNIKKAILVGATALASILPSKNLEAQNTHRDKEKNQTELFSYGEEKSPFNKEYITDDAFYRAVDCGKSTDIATAKKIAISNANRKIAEQVSIGNTVQLDFVKNLDEKLFKNDDGSYTDWVAIEMKK